MLASSGEPSVVFGRVEDLLMISSLHIAPVIPDFPFTKQHPRDVWRSSALGLWRGARLLARGLFGVGI